MILTRLKKIQYFSLIMLLVPFQLSGQTFGKRFISEKGTVVTTAQDERITQQSTRQEFILEKAIDPNQYVLGPGDKLGISIRTDKVVSFELIISPTEDILIPGVGLITLHNLSLSQARDKIVNYVRENAYQNAKIGVVLANIRIFKVQIVGAVNKPGFYEVTPVTRLHEVIEMAKGFHQFAREFDMKIVHSNGLETVVNYLDYIHTGNLANNPSLIEGDRIIVPFANVKTEGVVIRGSISGSGYDIIEKDETLDLFLRRRARFSKNVDLENIIITRNINGVEKYINVFPEDFAETVLKPGDQIDILSERGISVIGLVQAPGGFNYFPGYSISDYISLAGGNTVEGDASRAFLKHLDGSIEKGKAGTVRRGDVIIVPRTRKSIMFGDGSILQIIASIFSVILTFIAATR